MAATEKASFSSYEVDVFLAVPAGFLEDYFDGVDGAIMTHLGSTPLTAWATMRAMGVLPSRCARAFAGDDERRGAVIGARGVACGDGAVFFEGGLELGQSFKGSVFARRFVRLDHDGVALFLRDFHGHNLFDSTKQDLMAPMALRWLSKAKLVLLLARDVVFFGYQLAGHAHVEVFVRVPQAIDDHRVEQFLIAEAIAGARTGEQVRTIGHGLHAAGDHDFRFAERDALRSQSTAFRPEPQTLLMVMAATRGSRPPRSAAWRAGFWPSPAWTTLPMMTSSTCFGSTPARRTDSATTFAPSSGAERRKSAHEFSDRSADGA